MGTAIDIQCTQCHAKRRYWLGIGDQSHVREFQLSTLAKHHVPPVKHALKRTLGSKLAVVRQLAHCPRCHRLAEVAFGWVYLGDQRLYETDHYCRKCDEPLEMIEEEDAATIPCYKFGGRLTGWDEPTIYWD